MENNEKNIETINDLILINNDRIEGYKKAIADLGDGDADLKSLFESYITQTTDFNTDLTQFVRGEGIKENEGTSVSGKLHRAWIDIKATFTGKDRHSILAECERGEDATKKAYADALEAGNGLTPQQDDVIQKQAEAQLTAHNRIKALRDSDVA